MMNHEIFRKNTVFLIDLAMVAACLAFVYWAFFYVEEEAFGCSEPPMSCVETSEPGLWLCEEGA